jgi:aerobic-type carbon monoxide dehydrogenase small subunit (CoxS/CutS family)
VTDDQHGEGTPQSAGRWDPLPQGDYDDGATAFVKLPEGGVDGRPLAAPGHGYVPPQITVTPATTAGTDPAATGSWTLPAAPADGARWPDPNAVPHGTGDDRFTYNPGATGQWNFEETGAADAAHTAPAPGHDVTGQWSIPVAGGDLPDESGEFTTSSLVEQWGGTPPATLPGGAPAPWATEAAGRPWGQPSDTAQRPTGTDPGTGSDAGQHGHPGQPAGDGHGYGRPTEPAYDRPAGDGHGHAQSVGDGHAHEQRVTHDGEARAGHAPERFDPERFAPDPHAPHPHAPDPHGPESRGSDPHAPDRHGHAPHATEPHAPESPEPGATAPESRTPDLYAPQAHAPGSYAPERSAPEAHAPTEPYPTGPASEHPHGHAAERPLAPASDRPHPHTPEESRPHEAERSFAEPYADPPAEPAGSAPDGSQPAHGPGEAVEAAERAQEAAEAVEAAERAADAAVDDSPGDAADPESGPDADESAAAPETGDATPRSSGGEHPLASYVLRVNGVERPVTDAWIGESLLYVLRERLGLAGAKDGCSQGECGACNVQVDGRLVASCLVPAVTAAGSEVRTVEGLAVDGQPSDVQRALAQCGAVQCGFCVPGMAMTVHDLLEGNPAPSERETRQALCGNLCRCSGYRGVVDAVKEVVAEREAHSVADSETDADEPRIPHQAGPGAGGVNRSAFEPAEHDQVFGHRHGPGQGQDGGQA